MIARPAIFKWRQTEPGLILCAVRWYLRYSLSLRDVEELLEERGLNVDHTTVWRWVQYYGPELEQRLRRHSQADKQVLASGRNLRPCEGSLVLLVPGHRFQGSHHRFPAVSVARRRCCQAAVSQGAQRSLPSPASSDQHRLGKNSARRTSSTAAPACCMIWNLSYTIRQLGTH